jgi:hypothetical protein
MVVVGDIVCTVGGRHSKTSSAQSRKSRISFVFRVGGWVVTCSETY